jgi:hypothetical protein
MQVKAPIIEVNFDEKVIVSQSQHTVMPRDEAWDKFVLDYLQPLWHDPGKDEMQFFAYYTDGSYMCQRKKKRVDFQNQSSYWQTYQFNILGKEEAEKISLLFDTVFFLEKSAKKESFKESAKEFYDKAFYHEKKYMKMVKEIRGMLLYSDWRMCVDYEEEFDGEQEMWKTWRKALRRVLPKFDTFETAFDAFKAACVAKYPVDPNQYFKQYPDGKDSDGNVVEYMSTEDQFTKMDFIASGDFVAANMEGVVEYLEQVKNDEIEVESKMYELMDTLETNLIYPELKGKLFKQDPTGGDVAEHIGNIETD